MSKRQIVELNDDYKEEKSDETKAPGQESRPNSSPRTWLFDEPEEIDHDHPRVVLDGAVDHGVEDKERE